MAIFLGLVISYLLGSVPFGLFIGKYLGHVDVRQHGSGNIGATNVARVVGKQAGLLTLVCDFLKGFLPTLLFLLLLGTDTWGHTFWVCLAGFLAFLGHLYPVFLGFKGGKGVATAAGVFFALCPLAVIVDALIFGLVFWKWRYISLASIITADFLPILVALFSAKKLYVLLAIVIGGLVIYRHRSNILRLLKGEEPKFTSQVSPEASAGD